MGHCVHAPADVLPVWLLNVPAGQLAHVVCLASVLNVPAAQMEQTVRPAALAKRPMVQLGHTLPLPTTLLPVPAGQLRQVAIAVAPAAVLYLPVVQLVHTEAAAAE